MTRWEALVRYDDEIRAAAERLFLFGVVGWIGWVKRFFALSEDRKYLPNIVEQLTKEAEHDAVVSWLSRVSQTADGEITSKKAQAVLLDAHMKGYAIDVESNKTITVTRGGLTKYLRSNAEILQFGQRLSG